MRQDRRKGIALFLTLLVSSLIMMLLAATMTSTHGGNIFSQDYHRKTAALYAAESGLAMVQNDLENTPGLSAGDWADDTATVFGKGTFTVLSLTNNLTSDTETTGPYGPVAPRTAYVKIEGRALGQVEVIECVLGRRSDDYVRAAMVATGKIHLGGDVNITGRVSSNDLSSADADVVSNFDGDWAAPNNPLSWDSGDGTPLDDQVAGTIRSASSDPQSITPNLRDISSEALTDQAPLSVPNVNIVRAIEEQSSLSARVPTSPVAPVTNDRYEPGSVTVNGDLVLNGATLYVKDNLEVVGSISGVGAVYVGGNTTFSGHSAVVANEDGVVLYSQGNVHLSGFDGTRWMDGVTASQGKSAEWADTKEGFRLLNDYLKAYAGGNNEPMRSPPGLSAYWSNPAGIVLSHLATSVDASFRPASITHDNLLYEMLQVIRAEPAGPTQEFMLKKFSALRDPNRVTQTNPPGPAGQRVNIGGALGINYGYPSGANGTVVTEFLEHGRPLDNGLQIELFLKAGLLQGDTLGDGGLSTYDILPADVERGLTKHTHWLDAYHYNFLGSSYFQGRIYTRGAFYSSNEVTIIGTLCAVDDPTVTDTVWVTGEPEGDPVRLSPGDIHLGRGTRVLHISDLRPGLAVARPPVGVRHWLR